MHEIADVAVGVAAQMIHNQDGTLLMNQILTLSTVAPELNARIVTYAYPKYASASVNNAQYMNLVPTFYDGELVECLPSWRDRVLLPGPCYRTNIIIHHGASGGPVFSRRGAVFGVNSTGFDGTDCSYVSRINEILTLTIDGVAIPGESPRSAQIIELARAGFVVVD